MLGRGIGKKFQLPKKQKTEKKQTNQGFLSHSIPKNMRKREKGVSFSSNDKF